MIFENKEIEFIEYVTCNNCGGVFQKREGLTYQIMVRLSGFKVSFETHNVCSPSCFITEMRDAHLFENLDEFSGMNNRFIVKFLKYFEFNDEGMLITPNKEQKND